MFKKVWVLSLLLCSLAPASFALTPMEPPKKRTKVVKVISGDTIVLAGGQTIRLIGVEAPRKAKAGSAAESWFERSKAFTSGVVLNREVWLDPSSKKKSDSGETWALVFFHLKDTETLGGGGQTFLATPGIYMLNELVLKNGMATSGNPFAFPQRTLFKSLEQEARERQTGLFQSDF